MRPARVVLALFLAAGALPAYDYYFSDSLTTINPASWSQNGSLTPTSSGLTAPDAGGGSLISRVAVPDGTAEYEVAASLRLTQSGGVYVVYLRATPDAFSTDPGYGTYYAVEIQSPVVNGSSCSANMLTYKRSGGVVTLLYSTVVACRPEETVVRAIMHPSGVIVHVNGFYYMWIGDTSITTGAGGVGARATPAGNSITLVRLGLRDRNAPSPVNLQTVATSVYPDCAHLQWQTPGDGNGTGVHRYSVLRNDGALMAPYPGGMSDCTVSPSTSYSYNIQSIDYHGNYSTSTIVPITTPEAAAIDPRRIGVRPTGAYWGAMGEQVDMLSGNLNFSLPLLKPQGRGGWSVPVALSYNSQSWRYENGRTWKLGQDVGYGFGWRLLAGSLTPYWTGLWTIHSWVFTDASGAEYRLDVNTNGVWTSRQGLYMSWDSNTNRLYFPDGSFWVMDVISGGVEQDGGTRYPSLMQDTNGNQIRLRYATGLGAPWANSSARILEVEDVRAVNWGWGVWRTYLLTYNGDAIPHLTGIVNYIQTAECYTLSYLSQALASPFTAESFGTASVLAEVGVTGLGLNHHFTYNGSAELEQLRLPHLGELRWQYTTFAHSSDRRLREVQYRYLRKSAGAAEQTWTLTLDPYSGNRTTHAWATARDTSVGERYWAFHTEADWRVGLTQATEQRLAAGSSTGAARRDFTWTQDASGNPYIGTVLATHDRNNPTQKQSKTEQALDTHGNVLWTKVYDFGNLATPARTYTNTYLSDANYTSRYIFNRVVSTSVTPAGGAAVQLRWNSYDTYNSQSWCYNYWTRLDDVTGLRQHDTANYGTALRWRGNVTLASEWGRPSACLSYNIGGAVISSAATTGASVAYEPSSSTNYAAPTRLTPNSELNLSTSVTYMPSLAVNTVVAPNAASSQISYDSYGRPTSSTSPHGAVTSYTYTYNPSVQTATVNNRWERTTSDGLGRTIKAEKGTGSEVKSTVDTEYDACACSPLGKLKRVSQPYAPGGTIYWTTYTYDGLGRTLSISHPGNTGTTTYVYQGNTVKVIDPTGRWKTSTYDALGNLVQMSEPNPAGGTHETYYSYNAANQITGVSMPRGGYTQTRSFAYSGGFLTSATNPENGTVSYTWNGDGTLFEKRDAKGQRVCYYYDAYKRLTQVRRWLGIGQEDTRAQVVYHWDSNPFGSSENLWGRLGAVVWYTPDWAAGTQRDVRHTYSYTTGGRATRQKLTLVSGQNSAGLEATYAWDNEGRLTSMTYPNSGPTYNYAYDTLGRPSSGGPVTNVQYNAADQITSLAYLDYTETRQYNARNQLTRLSASGYGLLPVDLEYRYPATQNDGRITQMKDWATGEEVNYTYDSLARLNAAWTTGPDWGLAFGYDGFGNRTAQTVTKGSAPWGSVTFDPATNHQVGVSYDANGNPLGAWTWDIENRLQPPLSDEHIYGYGPNNERVYEAMPDGEEAPPREWVTFYGLGGEMLGRYHVVGTVSAFLTEWTNTYFGGKLVESKGQVVVQDRLGSTVVHGTERLSYWPYGEQKPGATAQNRMKFGTYFRDEDGKDYARQRYYASGMGRFLTPDPSGPGDPADPQSWNYYAYAVNNPVNLNDPEGLDVNLPPIADVDRPTCLGRVFREVITPSGFGTTNDDNAHTKFFSSLEGTFGLSLFFETRPNLYTTDREDPYYQAMLGVGFTYINRYAAQWGAESGFHTLKKVIMDASTPIWRRGAGDSRQMRGNYRDALIDILNGPPNDDRGDCDGLIFSLHLGQSMVAYSVGISHSVPRQMYVYNPVGNALSFHSGRNPYPLPDYWNKNLRYTKTLSTPGGVFHFFELPEVNIWP